MSDKLDIVGLKIEITRLNAALATARDDALEEAAECAYDSWMSGIPPADVHKAIRKLKEPK